PFKDATRPAGQEGDGQAEPTWPPRGASSVPGHARAGRIRGARCWRRDHAPRLRCGLSGKPDAPAESALLKQALGLQGVRDLDHVVVGGYVQVSAAAPGYVRPLPCSSTLGALAHASTC